MRIQVIGRIAKAAYTRRAGASPVMKLVVEGIPRGRTSRVGRGIDVAPERQVIPDVKVGEHIVHVYLRTAAAAPRQEGPIVGRSEIAAGIAYHIGRGRADGGRRIGGHLLQFHRGVFTGAYVAVVVYKQSIARAGINFGIGKTAEEIALPVKTVIVIEPAIAFQVHQRVVRYAVQVGMLKGIIVKGHLAGDELEIDDIGTEFGHFINVLETTELYGGIPGSIRKRNANAHGHGIKTAMVESNIIIARGFRSIVFIEVVKNNAIILYGPERHILKINIVRIAAYIDAAVSAPPYFEPFQSQALAVADGGIPPAAYRKAHPAVGRQYIQPVFKDTVGKGKIIIHTRAGAMVDHHRIAILQPVGSGKIIDGDIAAAIADTDFMRAGGKSG